VSTVVFIPKDAAALALGADQLADALAAEGERRDLDLRIVRNGSRGLFWLEPLVEVVTAAGRIAYGPVTAADLPELLAAGFLDGGEHPLCQGPVTAIPYLARQQRLTFASAGVTDPLCIEDYQANGGFAGLRAALARSATEVIREIIESGLRGRGGAAFPAGIKWQTVLDAPGPEKYVVCNADEGDSGSFADRLLMEADPYLLVEAMTIAGLSVGARRGIVYIRREYPHAITSLRRAIRIARKFGYLGEDLLDSGRPFDLEVFEAAGAYVCGEETALLESLEGRPGLVRAKPPLPAIAGLHGRPTLIHNVLTLAAVPAILARGGAWYRDFGSGRSRGTLAVQLAGNIARGGLVEVPFGLSLRELLYDFGGGSRSGRPLRAVQVGGPLGSYLPATQFDTPLDYEAFAALGGTLGHGSIVAFDDTVDMARQARWAMEFCALESCGKCTPCRIGATRGLELIDSIRAGNKNHLPLLEELCETMELGSLCALGGMTPYPVRSALRHFPEDFERP
jgi:formate dehydrogenase iron-sulfur subunit